MIITYLLVFKEVASVFIEFPASYLNRACIMQRFAETLRKLRRAGKIGEFVSIHVNPGQVC